MMALTRIHNFFFANPLKLGAQIVTSKDVVKIISSTATKLNDHSPYAQVAGAVFIQTTNPSKQTIAKYAKPHKKKISFRKKR